MDTKTCLRCGGSWPLSFFHGNHHGQKRARCIGCHSDRDHSPYRLTRKAINSIARHARDDGISRSEFAQRFAWEPQRMAADLLHALGAPCPYCLATITDPNQLSFDVIDPGAPPHYSANVRICCRRCNVAKKSMSPAAWAERLDTWARYRKWIAQAENNPVMGLPLFQKS